MAQLLLLIICLLAFHLGVGQSDYVVLTTGDTLRGKIKYLNYGVEKKVQLATRDSKNVYSILQTSAFSLEDEMYHPVRTAQGYTFMKLLKPGYLSLYAFQLPNQMIWDGRYLLKRDGTGQEVPNIGFKKVMIRFLNECEAVTAKIESGELSKGKLDEIMDTYNTWIISNSVSSTLAVQPSPEQSTKLSTWNQLETDVRNIGALESRDDALEMIQEIKSKIGKGERIPNFLIEGLKEILNDHPSVQEMLKKALKEIE
jgi:hypothetical protein